MVELFDVSRGSYPLTPPLVIHDGERVKGSRKINGGHRHLIDGRHWDLQEEGI